MAKTLKVIFLGGVDEIGKNMTAIEYSDRIVVVDAGMSFPTDDTPGIDYIIPDFAYLKSNAEKVKALFLTHGHEDHIGAVPHFLEEFDVPVYGTAMTLAAVSYKLDEHGVSRDKLHTVEYGEKVTSGVFTAEFVKVCHSIAGAAAISLSTPKGVVFFTGDYKVDLSPIDGKLTDLARMAEIGASGVKLLLADSTNVEEKGHSKSESSVGASLDVIFSNHCEKRIIITTFSSHNYRLQQIVWLAEKYGRKIALSGKSMRKFLDISLKLGEIKAPEGIFIDQGDIKKYEPGALVIISAGSQGEPMSALTRMSVGEYSKVKIGQDDLVVLSASPIPGNERLINRLINNLYRLGAEVINDDMDYVHSSGHAHQEEMKLLFGLLKPEYFVPVHGEYRHLKKHAEIAVQSGIPKENIFIPEIGMTIGISETGCKRLDNVQGGAVYADGMLLNGISGNSVLRDRKSLSDSGLVIALLILNRRGELAIPADITARGLSADEGFVDEARGQISVALAALDLDSDGTSIDVKAEVKRALKRYIANKYKQYPMIIPIIIEV
ncbi:MAG: ribonuclease J [Clostridiaceae bacterium]|jgi:ribonuclease J|nr:ribonuclease J [Clostridiaceae bacterium]